MSEELVEASPNVCWSAMEFNTLSLRHLADFAFLARDLRIFLLFGGYRAACVCRKAFWPCIMID